MPRHDHERRNGYDSSVASPKRGTAGGPLGAHEAYAFWQGMRDHPRTLETSFLAGFLEDIFGIEPRPIFRDKRLEAVRRLTVCFRRGLLDRLSFELPLARQAGVTENQIAALRSRIGRARLGSG